MIFYVNGYNIFLILLVTFLTSVLLTPVARKLSIHIGAVDKPNPKLKVHNRNMPMMGGLAIFCSFLLGYMLFAPKTTQMLSVLIGSFIILLLGLFDDIKSIPPRIRLVVQIIAACIVVFYGNVTFANMQIFGIKFQFGWFAKPLAILFIVGIINAINFGDGLDGLATGSSTIYFLTIAIIGMIMNKLGGLDVILCLIMAGACLGFLVHNFAPATIYLGDTGSTFLGFIIAIIALLGFKTATITSLIIPLLVLFVPIFDTIFAIGRRILKGKNPTLGDKEHLHHQLLKSTKSTRKSVLIMYFINALFASVSILYTLGNKKISIVIYCTLLILTLLLVIKTDILFEHKKKDK